MAIPRNAQPAPTRHAVRGVAPELDQLHHLAISLLRGVKVEDAAAGIGPALLSALSVLVFGGSHSLGALAAAEGVSAPTMSRLVNGLESAGLATRRSSPDDARSLRIQATRKGRAVLIAGRARRLRRLADAARALTQRQRRRVVEAIPALVALTEALYELPPPEASKRRTRRRFD